MLGLVVNFGLGGGNRAVSFVAAQCVDIVIAKTQCAAILDRSKNGRLVGLKVAEGNTCGYSWDASRGQDTE